MPSKYEQARADFDAAEGITLATKRVGPCREILEYDRQTGVPRECGLPLDAREFRRGHNVLVAGHCPEGHSFERAGYALPDDEGGEA